MLMHFSDGQLLLCIHPQNQAVPEDGYIWQDPEVSRRATVGGKVT